MEYLELALPSRKYFHVGLAGIAAADVKRIEAITERRFRRACRKYPHLLADINGR